MRPREKLSTDETGAEVVEFALVAPVVLFVLFGLIYGLLAVAAHVSLAHAASVGVRYAAIPTDPVAGVYPTSEDVAARVDERTPFFAASSCETIVAGEVTANAPVALDVVCDFPSPLGKAISGLRNLLLASEGTDVYDDNLQIAAHAEARRE